MANKDDYLAVYQRFFQCFAQTVNPNDQLPVKLASYKLVNLEVVGGIIDWTTQYLTQKQCPPSLLAPLIKIIIEEIRKNCKKNPIGCGYNTSAEVYEPLKLMQAVMAKTNEICLRYMDNSMLCSLPTPGPPHYVVSIAAIKNTRRKMEDRHVVIHDLNTMFNIQEASPSSYYAIFDGHAGHDAAAYSAVHLHQFLAESKHFVNNPEQALIDAFYKTDALFIDKEEFCSGTTAVCALLKPKERMLYIAWVGDSQALIVSKGVLYQCVVPHKPGREDEKDRIEQQGGVVVYWGTWRVNGQLAVSRAIGDKEYKPYVTAIPEVQEIPITANSDFVILACDGLWDSLTEEEAATTVYNMVCTNSDDTDAISHRLVQLAKNQGSTDNISVIVVFLREPSKVAADAHWANRNTTTSLLTATMETGLDNANAANNPFANSNGAEILQQKDDFLLNQPKDDFLLNLTEGFKQNGGAITSPTTNNLHFTNFDMNSANGKRQSIDEFDEDEDMGPETDVDAVDDIPSPLDVKQMIFHQDSEENQKENTFNPFTDIEEKGAFEAEVDLELQKQQSDDFETQEESMREETPTPPADKVHDATVEENVADSGEESEDEWNYFKGNSAAAETSASSLKTDQEVAELTKTIEEDEEVDMSQLNPNAAEFVPISSPTRNISSPACRAFIDDQIIAQSPRRATPSDIDMNVPNPVDFESEVKNRPSDVFNNGHDNENGHKLSSQEVMENLLNGKNLDEIEFYPNTPSKITNPNPEEFHFGPNATPFSTPAKPLDQSEALSTKALFGDESTASYLEGKTLEGTILLDSSSPNEKEDAFSLTKLKEQDPMSMSFYQDENEHNPFDLNKVQKLPENVDDFISSVENGGDNEKENLNPEFSNVDLLGISQLPKTPEPENLSESLEEKEDLDVEKDVDIEKIQEICDLPPVISPSLEEVAKQPLPITPEPAESLEDQNIDSQENQEDIVKETFETDEADLCKFSDSSLLPTNLNPPQSQLSITDDLLTTNENIVDVSCNMRKVSEIDSSPETEELSQISDAGDEVPPLCKSPEITSELDRFETDIKEVVQEVCQVPNEQVLSALSEMEEIIDDLPKFGEITTDLDQIKSNIEIKSDDVIEMETKVDNVELLPESRESHMEELCHMVSDTKMDYDLSTNQKSEEFLHKTDEFLQKEEEGLLQKYEALLQKEEELIQIEEELVQKEELQKEDEFLQKGDEFPQKEDELLQKQDEVQQKEVEFLQKDLLETDPEPPSHATEHEALDSLEKGETEIKESVKEEIVEDSKSSKEQFVTFAEVNSKIDDSFDKFESKFDQEVEDIPEPMQPQLSLSPEPSNEIFVKDEDIDVDVEVGAGELKNDDKIADDLRDLDSPMEDVTTSIKDDISSSEIIEEAKDISTEKEIIIQDSFALDSNDPVLEASQPNLTEELMDASQPVVEEKIVEVMVEPVKEKVEEVCEFLKQSTVPEILSPLSPVTQPIGDDETKIEVIEKSMEETIAMTTSEEVKDDKDIIEEVTTELIKTDIITPQYPEETTILTPSEEIKVVDASPVIELEQEPKSKEEAIVLPDVPKSDDSDKKEVAATAIGAAAAVAAVATGVAAITKSKEKKPLDKKPATKKSTLAKPAPPALASSKPAPSKTPTKSTTLKSITSSGKSPAPTAKIPTTKSLSAKTSTTPTSITKTPTKTTSAKPTAMSLTGKAIEKKAPALTNGEVKGASRLTKMTNKPSTATKTPSTTPKTTLPSKVSPTKADAPKSAPKTIPKTSTTTKTTMLSAKPRPTTLTAAGAGGTAKTANTMKSTVTKTMNTSPKTATAPPKPRPISAPSARQRSLGSTLKPKTPDTEKQIKDTVNKQLTATRTTVTTKTASSTASRISATSTTTTVKKAESKAPITARTTMTKTTMIKATKKPAEITRLSGKAKPATTKAITKPQENGTTEHVTMVVQETTAILTTEPQLVKDLSPVENKFIIDNSQVTENNVAD